MAFNIPNNLPGRLAEPTMKIDPALFDLSRLIETLLDAGGHGHRWRADAEIVPAYRPPRARDDKTRCVVRHGEWFLRYSKGPDGRPFWDMYGDDFLEPALALVALLRAPPPPSLGR